MAKRLLLIGAIVVTMAALCSNAAWAFRIPGGGLRGFGYYDMWFETVGRGGHIDQGNFAIVNGILDIQLGYNKSLNPGSGMFEISPGEGETVTQGYTTVDLTALERWGRSEDIIRVWNTVPEFAELLFGIYEECSGSTPPAACTDSDNDLYNNYENYEPCDTTLYHDEDTDTWDYVGLYDDCPDALTEWLGVWGGTESRNKNWTDYSFLIEDTYVVGDGYLNCGYYDTDPGFEFQIDDNIYCEDYQAQLVLYCSTDTPFATDEFDFDCQEPPEVFDDEYYIEVNTPLEANVLDNDSDRDGVGTGLVAILVEGPSDGKLTLNPDGSIIYKPKKNWDGVVTFTYKANDGYSDSYVTSGTPGMPGIKYATVTIHVEQPSP